MGTPFITDAELILLGAARDALPNILQAARDMHRTGACDLVRGVLGSRYVVPDPWDTTDVNVKRVAADFAAMTLLQYRGFDPETDKQVVARFDLSKALLEQMENGRYALGLQSLRRAKIGSQESDPSGRGWYGWRDTLARAYRLGEW